MHNSIYNKINLYYFILKFQSHNLIYLNMENKERERERERERENSLMRNLNK